MGKGTGRWPEGARAAVSVTFDNLGEAAEQELGLGTPTGGHYSVGTALPIVLDELADHGLSATFFVEGINAETYPQALRSIADSGHECAFHAWHHEDWSALSAEQERENLWRGLEAMRACGLKPIGFRPPGGLIGTCTLELLHEAGLRYCSPAGSGIGIDQIVLLPFAWQNVDAYHLLESFAALRGHIEGSPAPRGPARVADALTSAVDHAIASGGHACLVLHTWLIEAELDAVRRVLAHVRAAAERGEVWAARCGEVGQVIAQHPTAFSDAVELDTTSWSDPRAAAAPPS
jgi:peptidoglycan/xylan/chitin deacetylase (PgdA/CDA1 family)